MNPPTGKVVRDGISAQRTTTVSGTSASPATFTYVPDADYNGSDSFIGPDGTVYVVEQGGKRVQAFSQSGQFLDIIGASGSGDGLFNLPIGVVATTSGRVYVSELSSGRIQYFDKMVGGATTAVTLDEDGAPMAFVAPTLSASDADGDALTWSLASEPENGTATVSGSGASPELFTYVPAANFNGADSFVIAVSDENDTTDLVTVNVTVASVNDMPVLAAIGLKEVDKRATITFSLTATDEDGDALAFDAGDLPTGATFNEETATFSWTPTFEQSGVFTYLQFDALDTNGDGFLSEPELRGTTPVGGCTEPGEGDFLAYGLVFYLLAIADAIRRRTAIFVDWMTGGPDA